MKKVLLIAFLAALVATPAEAKSHSNLSHHIRKCRQAAPLPLAAGLPALALMGGALALVRRRRD